MTKTWEDNDSFTAAGRARRMPRGDGNRNPVAEPVQGIQARRRPRPGGPLVFTGRQGPRGQAKVPPEWGRPARAVLAAPATGRAPC